MPGYQRLTHYSEVFVRRTKLAVLVALLALLAACGGTTTNSTASGGGTPSAGATPTGGPSGACVSAGTSHLAKTRFLLHVGIAFGAFHRYIYNPYRAGSFKAGAAGRTAALAKAGASALVVAYEIKQAEKAAAQDPTLCHLLTPLTALSGAAAAIGPALTGGTFNPTQLLDLKNKIDEFKNNSSSSGAPITER